MGVHSVLKTGLNLALTGQRAAGGCLQPSQGSGGCLQPSQGRGHLQPSQGSGGCQMQPRLEGGRLTELPVVQQPQRQTLGSVPQLEGRATDYVPWDTLAGSPP